MQTMVSTTEERGLYQSQFENLGKSLRTEPRWLAEIRKAAMDRFLTLGFPTTKDEEWRFTSVTPISRIPFKLADGLDKGHAPKQVPQELTFGFRHSQIIVFVNGRFAPKLSTLKSSGTGVQVETLESCFRSDPKLLSVHLSHYAGYDEHAFVALNTAFFRDGIVVRIPKDVVVEKPVHLMYLSTQPEEPVVSYLRTLILAESNSQAKILESYAGLSAGLYMTNAVTEIVLGENAVLDHYKLQRESAEAFHVASLCVNQSRDSNFFTHSISLGGLLVRNDVNVVLGGDGGEAVLDGLYIARGQQHVDNHTRIDHASPHCTSRELYKGILDEKARGVFNGRILVRQGAQKTDSKQTNKNLLLSEDALANANPQLEIYADDVKCTHGVTIGQLSAEALFYLRSRGISLETARQVLTYAFASEITSRIKVSEVQAELEKVLYSDLPWNQELKDAL
jgi:Fe-S cluster assembly protein SufD